MSRTLLATLIFWAGIGQLVLITGSLAIPRVLGWAEQTAKFRPLIRQVFWTYAAYIWATNLGFGLLSALSPGLLVDGSPLAGWVSLYIALYWGARVLIQFFYFDRSDAPTGPLVGVAEAALVTLFVALTAVYGCAAVGNLAGLWTDGAAAGVAEGRGM
jgi:hypothetical protein